MLSIHCRVVNTICTADKTFSFLACRRQRSADEKLSFVTGTFVSSAGLLKGNPLVNNRGFPFKGNNSGIHFRYYNVFGARKLCQIDDLLPLNFRTQMVSLIQDILTKNLETICRVILTKTSQKMIVNLLMIVLIYLPICQHHVSGYVCLVWHLGFFFFFSYWLK